MLLFPGPVIVYLAITGYPNVERDAPADSSTIFALICDPNTKFLPQRPHQRPGKVCVRTRGLSALGLRPSD